MIYDCIIIGAGASGLFCAGTMNRPLKGLILEKTDRAGRKLLMSGNGQCNITHGGSIKDFPRCYGDNGKKIRSCLYKYNNLSLMNFLEKNGVATATRSDGKVFPASMDARDVLQMLLQKSQQNGFSIEYGRPVSHMEKAAEGWRLQAGNDSYFARTVVVATGGCSYPKTGSDGSMFDVLARDLDISIIPPRPALSSLQVGDYPYAALSGISFEQAQCSIWRAGKRLVQNADALLLTHSDLSGPAILNISKFAEPGDTLKINYLYPLSFEEAFQRLKHAVQGTKGELANIMTAEFQLPKRFCQILTRRYGSSLKALATALTGEDFSISSVSGFEKAMVTCGGIALDELDTKTMAFRNHPGLFAIGEACDIDGVTGGYNLQFAYSSAKAAGDGIFDTLT
ncbi:MAG: aminoacetone oxidase family FAD-binding enzyme [Bacillota bacterium]|nr:aminoacetone oxidase family FAD-binding enzyme [Bacillota bacterium]